MVPVALSARILQNIIGSNKGIAFHAILSTKPLIAWFALLVAVPKWSTRWVLYKVTQHAQKGNVSNNRIFNIIEILIHFNNGFDLKLGHCN